jgi:hypothetical protein
MKTKEQIINKVAERYGKMWDIKPHVLAGKLWWKDAIEDALIIQGKEVKDAVENLPNPYPEDIFPKLELSEFQTIEINNFLLHNSYFGFAFDRLSAELMRRARENLIKELLKVLGEK